MNGQWIKDEDGQEFIISRDELKKKIKSEEKKEVNVENVEDDAGGVYIKEAEINESTHLNEKFIDARIKQSEDLKEKIQELSIKAKRGLIIAPIGFFLNKCPDCGRNIDKVVLRDGGYPDYGSKYKYYSCSCGYEFGKVVF